MLTPHAKTILAAIPAENQPDLFNAFRRYMEFTGVWSGETVDQKQVKADRAAYPELFIQPRGDHQIISNENCVKFMAEVTKLPVEWCYAWEARELEIEQETLDELNVVTDDENNGISY